MNFLWILLALALIIVSPIFMGIMFIIFLVMLFCYLYARAEKTESKTIYSVDFLFQNAPIVYVSKEKFEKIQNYIDENGTYNENTLDEIIKVYISDEVSDFTDDCDKVIMFSPLHYSNHRFTKDIVKYAYDIVFIARSKYYVNGSLKLVDVKKICVGVDGRVGVNPYSTVTDFNKELQNCNFHRDRIMHKLGHEYDSLCHIYKNSEYITLNKRLYNDLYEKCKKSNLRIAGDKFYYLYSGDYDEPGKHPCVLIKNNTGEMYKGYIEVFPHFTTTIKRFVGNIVWDNA